MATVDFRAVVFATCALGLMAGEAACAQSAPAAEPNSASPEPSISKIPACDKPGGMGLSRIVEIDTTGGPGFGFETFKQYDSCMTKRWC